MELAGQTASRKQISNSGLAITLTDLWRSIYQHPKREKEFPAMSRGKGNQWIFGILAMHSSSLSFWWLFSCTKCKMLQDLVVINTSGKVSILCWCWKRELWGREPFMATRDTRSCQTVQQPNFQNRTRSKLCFLIFFCTCHQASVRPLVIPSFGTSDLSANQGVKCCS